MTFTAFRGAAKRIEAIDLPRIGARIGVGEDEMHAILDVEAAGKGFDSQGRITILFEPHIFYKLLGNTAKRKAAVAAKLACPKARGLGYSVPSYQRLLAAIEIDETIALQSASWGLGQLMGFHHRMAGYPTVQAMVTDFADSEAAQLNGMVRFIVASHLDDELRRHDWTGFARGYNGPGYRENNYDTKLRDRFNHWMKIKDTPYKPESKIAVVKPAKASAPPAPPLVEAPAEAPADPPPPPDIPDGKVKAIQAKLAEIGYKSQIVSVDGDLGDQSHTAIYLFQREHDLPPTGELDAATEAAIWAAGPRVLPASRTEATADDLRAKGSTTIAAADDAALGTKLAIGSGAVAAGSQGLEALQKATSTATTIKDTSETATGLVPWFMSNGLLIIGIIATCVAGYFVWTKIIPAIKTIVAARVRDHQTMNNTGR